jgi:hypothetical protein
MKYLVFILLVASCQLALGQFKFTAVNISGATETQVRGVNSTGEIVGFYKTTNCVEPSIQFPNCDVHGFKIINGKITKLMVPDSVSTAIMGVNDDGDLVGFCITSDGYTHGFFWPHQGVVQLLNAPGGGENSDAHTVAMGVNDSLTVVGGLWFYSTPTPQGGWVWANGTFSTMDPGENVSGTCCWGVNGISNSGYLSGQNSYEGYGTAWFKSGTDEDFYPLNENVVGTAVNNNADVIGFTDAGVGYFAKRIEANEGENDSKETPPKFITVVFPGASATYPLGLNNNRTVVGAYVDSTGTHGFIATPKF